MFTSTRGRYNESRPAWTGPALLVAGCLLMIASAQAWAQGNEPDFRSPAVFNCDSAPYGLALGNLNQDRFADLVVGCYGSASVVVYINQGDWQGDPPTDGFVPFDPEDPTNPATRRYSLEPYGDGVREVALARVNSDWLLDVVVPYQTAGHTTQFAVFYNQGDGQFAEPPDIYAPALGHEMRPVRGLVVADLDKDGRIDVALAEHRSGSEWWYDRVYVIWGTASRWFEAEPTVVELTDAGGHYVSEAYDLTLGYFDDTPWTGTLDFATCNYGTEHLSVVLNNGDRTFTPLDRIDAPQLGRRDITTSDFNADGCADLACPNTEWFPDAHEVRVWRGDGTGYFEEFVQSPFPVVLDARAIASGPICGHDTLPEIVCVNRKEGYPDGSISVLVNEGGGDFSDQYEFLVEPPGNQPKPVQVLIGQVDGAGHKDVVTSNWYTGNVSVLINEFPLAGIERFEE